MNRLVDNLVSLRAAAVLTVVGAVAGIAVGDVPGVVIACLLIGTAGVIVVSNIFLRIGLGEERAREAEAEERAPKPPAAPERHGPATPDRRRLRPPRRSRR
ncbi:MAG: hypothetical protein JWN32_3095 [Solirubrobacterales bacterium]|nr:hypothetical protein [Solirubrobacterales bacterium]